MTVMTKKAFPALILAMVFIAGCQKPEAAPVAAPATTPDATSTSAPATAMPSAHPAAPARKTTSSRNGIFAGMVFPMSKAAFITQLNARLRDNCKRPDRHGQLCPKLEQRSTVCSSVVKRPVVTDADAARDVGGKYLRCLHRGHA